MYSTTRKRRKKYQIFCHFLDFTIFNLFIIHRKHGVLQFCMEIIQKLFQKNREVTPPEVMPERPLRSLPPDLAGRFSGRHFLDLNHPTGARKQASKRYVVCVEKNDRSDTEYTVMFHFVQYPVSSIYHTPQGQ
jgi:hypothetical protein